MTSVAPPATLLWYDLAPTVSSVLAILRLSDGDVDEGRITELVPAAAAAIDAYNDGEVPILGPPPPPPVQAALEEATVELYRRQGPGTDPYTLPGASRDALDALGVAYGLLGPLRRRWGIA